MEKQWRNSELCARIGPRQQEIVGDNQNHKQIPL
jgi:hypothetical protein